MEIADSIHREEDLTRQFSPDTVIIYDGFEIEEHFNVVLRTPERVREALRELTDELTVFGELSVVSPSNYHTTVLIVPLSAEQALQQAQMPKILQQPLSLMAKGIHIRPNGVYLNTYSPDGTLKRLREALAKHVGVPFDPRSRLANVGWISLAHFVSQPTPQLVELVQSKMAEDFGTFQAAASLHRSHNRQQLGPVIWEF